mmetsp:Transcript_21787/g.32973  ORF Transcript_21787/g.32973 Transcript_21787/m.32973 type:complete len:228 (+) Transcript_21787:2026-2709(+)
MGTHHGPPAGGFSIGGVVVLSTHAVAPETPTDLGFQDGRPLSPVSPTTEVSSTDCSGGPNPNRPTTDCRQGSGPKIARSVRRIQLPRNEGPAEKRTIPVAGIGRGQIVHGSGTVGTKNRNSESGSGKETTSHADVVGRTNLGGAIETRRRRFPQGLSGMRTSARGIGLVARKTKLGAHSGRIEGTDRTSPGGRGGCHCGQRLYGRGRCRRSGPGRPSSLRRSRRGRT